MANGKGCEYGRTNRIFIGQIQDGQKKIHERIDGVEMAVSSMAKSVFRYFVTGIGMILLTIFTILLTRYVETHSVVNILSKQCLMKKLLFILLILLPVLCSAQTATPTPSRVMAWFTVPVMVVTPSPSNAMMTSQYYFGSVTITSYYIETIASNRVLLCVKAPMWQIRALSATATCTFLWLDWRYAPNAIQAKNSILRQAQAMGETAVKNANAFVY